MVLGAFAVVAGLRLRVPEPVDCGCFGRMMSRRIMEKSTHDVVVRSVILALLTVWALPATSGRRPDTEQK